MEITDAIDSMARILDEERKRPTISYRDSLSDLKATFGEQKLDGLGQILMSASVGQASVAWVKQILRCAQDDKIFGREADSLRE